MHGGLTNVLFLVAMFWALTAAKSYAQAPVFAQGNFVRGELTEGKRSEATTSATVKLVSGTPQLFLREGNNGEFVKPSHKLATSSSRHANAVGLSVRTWCFSPDGTLVAVGWGGTSPSDGRILNNEGAIDVWEVSSGKLVSQLRGGRSTGTVLGLAFGEDGKTVIYSADRWFVDGP